MSEDSAWQSVIDFLEHFRRPSAALWTGISSAGTDEGFLEGARKGFMLEPGAKELADVLELPEGQADDPWLPWLGKEGLRLGANFVGDPLPWACAPAKAKGVIGPVVKALGVPEGTSAVGHAMAPVSQKLAARFESSPWFKTFGHRLSSLPEFEEDIQRIGREGSTRGIRETAEKLRTELAVGLEEAGGRYTAADVFEAMERGTKDPDMQALVDIVQPYRELRNKTWDELNTLREANRFEPKASITEAGYEQMPRHLTDTAIRRVLRMGESTVDPEAWKEASRQLFRWEDEAGNVRHVGKETDRGLKKVKELDDEGRIIKDAEGNPTWKYLFEGVPVSRKQASLSEVQPLMGKRTFVDNPVSALEKSLLRDQSKINMLKVLEAGKGRDLILHQGLDEAPETMRALKMVKEGTKATDPWEIYAADPRVANRMENMMGVGTGMIDELLGKITDSKLGRIAQQAQELWKREILTNMGFYTGNAISNVGLLYNDGVAAHKIFPRIIDAIRVRTAAESPIFQTWKNSELLRFAEDSGLTKTGWAGTMEKQHALTGMIEDYYPEKAGKATVQAGAEKWDKIKDWLFSKLGAEPEDNAKLARWLDYIMESAPDFDKLTRDEQIRIMDRGILRAKDALVDYTNLAPTERKAQFFVPFLAWMRGITGLTAEQAVTNPQKFAQMARFLDTAFEPLPAEDRDMADAWVKEQSPVVGALGGSFGTDERGNDRMLLLNRFLPQGNIEQMMKRPGDFAVSAATPLLKVPIENLTNRSSMKDAPIDRLSKGTLSHLWAPLLDMTGRTTPYETAQNRTFGHEFSAGWDKAIADSPAGRHVKTLNDFMRSVGMFDDPYKPISDDSTVNRAIGATGQFMTGSRFYGFDPAKYQHKRKAEKDRYVRQIKSNLKYANMVGDDYGIEHYEELLAAVNEDPGRFLEGGY